MATVAQVAADEPETEPKRPQASTFTCISRPGSQLSQGARPRNISSESFVRNRISPIQMKSGRAASVQDAELPQIVVASTEPAGMPPPTNCMPTQPQAMSAIAIHTPPARSRASSRSSRPEISMSSMTPYTPLWIARSTTSSAVVAGGFS